MYKKVKESEIEITELMLPSNTNFGGKIHGGYILSLMDQVAFACASKHSGMYCVTASVDKVNFLNPIEVGELVSMKASINYIGKTSMVVGIRVESENIQTGSKKHCNSSYFTMVAKEKQEVPGLILENKQHIKRFIKAIKRREGEKERAKSLSKVYENIDCYIKELEDYRIKIDL